MKPVVAKETTGAAAKKSAGAWDKPASAAVAAGNLGPPHPISQVYTNDFCSLLKRARPETVLTTPPIRSDSEAIAEVGAENATPRTVHVFRGRGWVDPKP